MERREWRNAHAAGANSSVADDATLSSHPDTVPLRCG
jgi:hypothetical protein